MTDVSFIALCKETIRDYVNSHTDLKKARGGHFRYQESEKALNIPITAGFSFRILENEEGM